MGKNRNQDSVPKPVKQGGGVTAPEPDKIKASTPIDFEGRNLTAYGGLLPVATMLEKLGFLDLVAEPLRVTRPTKPLTMPQFILAMVLASYIGFSRLYLVRFLQAGADADRNSRRAAPSCYFAAVETVASIGRTFPGFCPSRPFCLMRFNRARLWFIGIGESRWRVTRPA